MENQKQWGLTKAISNAPPTKADLELNDRLVEGLKARENFETPEGSEIRKQVLEHFEKAAKKLVTQVALKKGVAPEAAEKLGAKVFPFGSYALGVFGPSSDIDTCIVGPKIVSREDYFQEFRAIFYGMSDAKDITEFVMVPDAFVPIIKIEYRGIAIDLVYCSLRTQSTISHDIDLISNTNILQKLEEVDIRTINGPRVVQEMLAAVPEHKSFRLALRTIKLWANQRGVYGAVFGYPGGIAWAIMVARIAQLFPKACGATLVCKFFHLMLRWPWPRPVMLKDVDTNNPLNHQVWNPTQDRVARSHIMPVITPAYPQMCSTHGVTRTTMAAMMDEFKRGAEITARIQDGQSTWDELLQRHTFFTKDHKFYLSVIATSLTPEADENFKGLVKSKITRLSRSIEDSDQSDKRARPYMKEFDRVHRCANPDQIERVKQGSMDYQIKKADLPEDGQAPAVDGTTLVYTSTLYIGLTVPEGEYSKSLDISYPVTIFRNMVEEGNKNWDSENMFCRVVHTRNINLPDDVFVEGETKPTKTKKKSHRSNGTSSRSRKRQLNETEPEVRSSRPAKTPRSS
ncbi:Poly(A) polymerase [Periconia macrospinosa]|uniref:Poly(A) polymerase n=1 Tax=Periconia macrospinosa TaxID=97972 RepID=A0A2V1DGB4_9PLEO|nr:Poly(A) polymerase [Periconia macrospinosa]